MSEIRIPPGTMSTKQVAELLGVTVNTVKHWVYNGKLPEIQRVRTAHVAKLYRIEDVMKFKKELEKLKKA